MLTDDLVFSLISDLEKVIDCCDRNWQTLSTCSCGYLTTLCASKPFSLQIPIPQRLLDAKVGGNPQEAVTFVIN